MFILLGGLALLLAYGLYRLAIFDTELVLRNPMFLLFPCPVLVVIGIILIGIHSILLALIAVGSILVFIFSPRKEYA